MIIKRQDRPDDPDNMDYTQGIARFPFYLCSISIGFWI